MADERRIVSSQLFKERHQNKGWDTLACVLMKSGILSFQTQAGKILQGSGAILREMQNKSWNTPASKRRFELRLKRLQTNYF